MTSYMFKPAIATLLCIVLSIDLAAGEAIQSNAESAQTLPGKRVRERVAQMRLGTLIAIRFTNGVRERGYLSQVDTDGFRYRVGDPKTGDEHRTAFNAVRSVKEATHTPLAAWVVAGCIVAALAVVLVVFLAERHNEGG